MKDNRKYYSASFPGESERLEAQGKLLEPIASRLKKKALDHIGFSDSLMFDIGCADGKVTRMWFSQFSKVYGLDYDAEAIKRSTSDDQFSFYLADVTTKEGLDVLKELIGQDPVLLAMTLLIHNISSEKQEPLLYNLKEILPQGSVIFIITCDHKMNLHYPDQSFSEMISYWKENNSRISDPAHGRKLPGQLYRSGWTTLDFSSHPILLPQEDNLREEMFYVFNDFRKQKEYKSKKEEEVMKNFLDRLRNDFKDPEFFFQAQIFSAIATNK